jgi:DNA-binding CsgD family transcriptional regulator
VAAVGRTDEVARVGRALRRPDLAGAVLTGAPGVGKSRIMAECLRTAEGHGFVTARVLGSPAGRDIPFAAFAPYLSAGAAGDTTDLFAHARSALTARAGSRPLLLAVDDAHHLDDASALLVHQIAADLSAFVLATVRSGERVPDPVMALWRDGLAERVEVQPLQHEHVSELLAAMLGGPVDPSLDERLWGRCDGNALYLRELVLGARDAGTLVRVDGVWHLQGELGVPQRLVDVIAQRLQHLGDDERRAFALVSFGEPMGVDLLEQAVAPDTLEWLEKHGLIRVETSGKRFLARPAHPLHADVLRAQTPPLQARSLLRTLADLLERTGLRRRGDLLRLATWRLDAGGSLDAEQLLAAAGEAALARDNELGERLARRSWEARPSIPAAEEMARCLHYAGRQQEALAALAAAEPLATSPELRWPLARWRATVAFWGQGLLTSAEAELQAAIDELPQGSAARAEARSLLAMALARGGWPVRALDVVAAIEADNGDQALPLQAVNAKASALVGAGLPTQGLRLIESVLAERGDTLSQSARDNLRFTSVRALLDLGRLDEAEREAAEGYVGTLRHGELNDRAYFAFALAQAALAKGRIGMGRKRMQEAAALFRVVDRKGFRRAALAYSLLAAAQMNDHAGIAEASRELAALQGLEPDQFSIELRCAEGWSLVSAGNPTGAKETFAEAAAMGAERGLAVDEGFALIDLARMGGTAHALQRLRELALRSEGAYLPALATFAEGLHTRDPHTLAAAADQFEAIGVMLWGAEAATAAQEAFARARDQRAASAWARKAAEMRSTTDGADTPGLMLVEAPVPLTRREREVATLVARGMASKVVAERLFLSVRTVENHLAHVYDKLGVSNRAELADALRASGDGLEVA